MQPDQRIPSVSDAENKTEQLITCACAEVESSSQRSLASGTFVTDASEETLTLSSGFLRPILVGYAFGPKKMSTMGIIMAEAQAAVTMAALPVVDRTDDFGAIGSGKKRRVPKQQNLEKECMGRENSAGSRPCRLTPAALEERSRALCQDLDTKSDRGLGYAEHKYASVANLNQPPSGSDFIEGESIGSGHAGIRFSIAGTPNGDEAGIRNIVRFFQSSGSSSASFADSSITTLATTVPVPPSSTSPALLSLKGYTTKGGNSTINPNGTSCKGGRSLLQPVRVCFVPLDLNSPLEEQHGGNFDAILHKMTEDILSISNIDPSALSSPDSQSLHACQLQSLERIERLSKYKQNNQACTLIDHPSNVQALMSRSDIAHTLFSCLLGVTTRSGIPVSTPRFEVLKQVHSTEKLAQLIDSASFTYPLIAKPLMAAGTVESHRMVVILNRDGLARVPPHCILQEYANHDGVLFKVYVMGDLVRVFSRTSLPNLPSEEAFQRSGTRCDGYVEFDSQRPYPKLSDFGITTSVDKIEENDGDIAAAVKRRKLGKDIERDWVSCKPKQDDLVTTDEIQPIATALRNAFGLELFGFDILVTAGRDSLIGSDTKEILVVDVNYFPSYKEVSNFPSLLAQYLAEKAIEGRIKSGQWT